MKTTTTFRLYTLAIAAVIFSSCSINKMTEKQFSRAQQNEPFDVVIVPGAPIGDSALGNILMSRMLWSKYLYDNKITKNIIYSGAAVQTPYIEGVAMKMFADSLGIPSEHTFAEIRAEHSTENVYYSYLLAKKMGFTRIALATDIFQTMMVSNFTKKRMPDVKFIPISFRRLFVSKKEFDNLPMVNVGEAHVDESTFVSLNQREGFFKRLSGTMGKNIKIEHHENPAYQDLIAYNDSVISLYFAKK